jgi:hypothetical protein
MRISKPRLQRNHIGLDGFIWAIGVVEDRNDPLFLGRCRVRYFGWHTENKLEMPTAGLPWSYPLTDLDSGRNVVGPKEGDWIVGFFRDGVVAQEPVMIGVVPGIPEIEADPAKGFNDPRPDSILAGHQVPREPLSFPIQHDDGSGSELIEMGSHSRFPQNEKSDPLLTYVNNKESTASRFERNEFIDQTLVQIKKDNIDIGQRDIPVAIHPSSEVGSDHKSDGKPFTEQETQYATLYPYNHAYYSEGGHLIERDDTPGKERLHWFHRAGTFKEIHPQGLIVEKIVDDEFHIVLKSRYTHIEAMDIETVDWNKKLFVNKDCQDGYNYDVTIGEGGDYNLTIRKGLYDKYVMDGDENIRIKKNRNYLIEENESGEIKKDKYVLVDKDYTVHVYGYTNIITHENATITALKSVNINAKKDMNLSCVGDFTLDVGGKLTTKVAGSRTDLTLGSSARLTVGAVIDACPDFFIRIAEDIMDLSFGQLLGHTIWSDGPVNVRSPKNVYINDTVPAMPMVDPPIPPGQNSIAEMMIKMIIETIIKAVIQQIIKKMMAQSDSFSVPSAAVAAAASSVDSVAAIELQVRELSAAIFDEKYTEPIVPFDAPEATIWSPVNMEGVATMFFPSVVSPEKKNNSMVCKLLDTNGKFVENAQYVKSIYGCDLFKFAKDGRSYISGSEEFSKDGVNSTIDTIQKDVKVVYNGYEYLIGTPAKMCRGNGNMPVKVGS